MVQLESAKSLQKALEIKLKWFQGEISAIFFAKKINNEFSICLHMQKRGAPIIAKESPSCKAQSSARMLEVEPIAREKPVSQLPE
jgi:hypothetical protein